MAETARSLVYLSEQFKNLLEQLYKHRIPGSRHSIGDRLSLEDARAILRVKALCFGVMGYPDPEASQAQGNDKE